MMDVELPTVFLGGLSTVAAVLIALADSFLYRFPAGAVTENAAPAPARVVGAATVR